MRVISDPVYGVVVLAFDDNEDKQNMINNLQMMDDDALPDVASRMPLNSFRG